MMMIQEGAINVDNEQQVSWEEILEQNLQIKRELNEVAGIAYNCVKREGRRRLSMSNIVLLLTQIINSRY